MSVPFDDFTGAFLSKITEFDFSTLFEATSREIIDGYMKMAIIEFSRICKHDLINTANYEDREFNLEIAPSELYEIINIVSEGMVVQWLKPYVYRQEILENAINTRDYTTYSPAELLLRIGNAYTKAQKDYIQAQREYSYNTGDLSRLHL